MEIVKILLVEDNEGDIVLAREAFAEAGITNQIESVTDGEQALLFLRGGSRFEAGMLPDLILLDINLPKIGGIEILKTIKSDTRLRHIPVLILTTSSDERDIFLAYDNHANCYLQKPLDLPKFIEVIHGIGNFWLEVVTLRKIDIT